MAKPRGKKYFLKVFKNTSIIQLSFDPSILAIISLQLHIQGYLNKILKTFLFHSTENKAIKLTGIKKIYIFKILWPPTIHIIRKRKNWKKSNYSLKKKPFIEYLLCANTCQQPLCTHTCTYCIWVLLTTFDRWRSKGGNQELHVHSTTILFI